MYVSLLPFDHSSTVHCWFCLFGLWSGASQNRLVISVKNGTHYQYDLDGQLMLNGTAQSVDGRFALDNMLLIFADENGENSESECAELAIWNYSLTAEEIQALDGYGHQTGVRDAKENQVVIEKYNLFQNYPNPFNPNTTIAYSLARPGKV